MNIALIGSGGREHALALAIKKSSICDTLYCYPGNTGTSSLAINVPIEYFNWVEFLAHLKLHDISFVVVGPEIPLVDGIVDFLEKEGIVVFGPTKSAAAIEANKVFAKEIMAKAGVPTASYREFNASEFQQAEEYIRNSVLPVVLKANGLAAGKGVAVCLTLDEALSFLQTVLTDKAFGSAGETLLVEEFMEGDEASLFAITDGEDFLLLPVAQDHKRIGEGDTGKNTGGMGAYAPAPIVTDNILEQVKKDIIEPTLREMKAQGTAFKGCLYCGLMLTKSGPKVVEFNCRFGDPETQVVLPLLEGDIARLFYSASIGKLDKTSVSLSNKNAVCVVLASGGYPDSFEKGKIISGLDSEFDESIIVYHAGTKKTEQGIESSGGRVLAVTSVVESETVQPAIEKAYKAIDLISFEDMYFRRDIAKKAL